MWHLLFCYRYRSVNCLDVYLVATLWYTGNGLNISTVIDTLKLTTRKTAENYVYISSYRILHLIFPFFNTFWHPQKHYKYWHRAILTLYKQFTPIFLFKIELELTIAFIFFLYTTPVYPFYLVINTYMYKYRKMN